MFSQVNTYIKSEVRLVCLLSFYVFHCDLFLLRKVLTNKRARLTIPPLPYPWIGHAIDLATLQPAEFHPSLYTTHHEFWRFNHIFEIPSSDVTLDDSYLATAIMQLSI